jgi:hypothetical protein
MFVIRSAWRGLYLDPATKAKDLSVALVASAAGTERFFVAPLVGMTSALFYADFL